MSGKKKILLVDDDPVFCEVTQEILGDIGYDAVAAADEPKACAVFFDNPHQFDLILLDHVFTEGELAAEFLEVRPDIPIALYTGAIVRLEEVRSKGICAVINKPLTKDELSAAIGRVLKQ